ncbi:hypothetical protein A2230_04510 [candidate division WOR-1 bacterium RIFOXYA2_FULL_36_21]|uniref:YchF C-terminal domain-containing protein n=1 Tax=candidate division WOR-1 bacterium RIFOXYB2_FULL_36_35 TaxID=1802578 RepID=A0A1F4S2H0_UNCSA|nr:MAG: hypothetical protein A2230_04510 [candidate division WOR-1 bacterium RIFOXYA2_FULL_36_21]OGC14656.1 MAG: hypothetical protein A2290_01240 [candidate division WOR-1 bacterium RIFOXYB2_FULL_36_35]OGC19674.1 MAG: hypothetical protein A2282_02965 [candidate division WOR-1 bacterium RIFOXYA12_FULL_36_13]
MKTAIIGNSQSGKEELFSLITGISLPQITEKPLEPHIGACNVKDPRITKLVQMYNPKKTTYVKIEYLLLPNLDMEGPTKKLIMDNLKNADEICFVVKEVSAKNEIPNFLADLLIADLVLAEKRIETMAKDKSTKFATTREKEKELMDKCKKLLDEEKHIKTLNWSEEEMKLLKTYQFYTLKPIFIALNVSEDKIKDDALCKEITSSFNIPAIPLSVVIEKEIADLPESDQQEFMKELGIDEPAVNKMNRLTYEGLGLISYFTVGEDEVRAWTVRRGALAPEAGAAIHTDIQKGFVKAEMFKYNDLTEAGSETKLKELGKFHLKGRDYLVEDGDILSFRFNV